MKYLYYLISFSIGACLASIILIYYYNSLLLHDLLKLGDVAAMHESSYSRTIVRLQDLYINSLIRDSNFYNSHPGDVKIEMARSHFIKYLVFKSEYNISKSIKERIVVINLLDTLCGKEMPSDDDLKKLFCLDSLL